MTEATIAPADHSAQSQAPEEPGEFGVIGFTNVSPNTGTRKQYVALKTPIGWQVTGAGRSERIPRVTDYSRIVSFADEGSIIVLGELPVPAQPEGYEAPSGTATVPEDDGSDLDDEDNEDDLND